jgi:hypothetical protein
MNDEARIVVAAQAGLRIVTAADIQDALGATFGAQGEATLRVALARFR